MAKKIALIDDETWHINYYQAALRATGFNPTHYKSPASCLTDLSRGQRYALYLTDLMMPSYGAYSKEDTEDYLQTGAMLAKDVRSFDSDAPIIIFTNMNIDAVLNDVQALLSDVPNTFLLRKSDYQPNELADVVYAILEEGKSPAERRGVMRRFWDSLVLEPNVFGVGIDLKKLGR